LPFAPWPPIPPLGISTGKGGSLADELFNFEGAATTTGQHAGEDYESADENEPQTAAAIAAEAQKSPGTTTRDVDGSPRPHYSHGKRAASPAAAEKCVVCHDDANITTACNHFYCTGCLGETSLHEDPAAEKVACAMCHEDKGMRSGLGKGCSLASRFAVSMEPPHSPLPITERARRAFALGCPACHRQKARQGPRRWGPIPSRRTDFLVGCFASTSQRRTASPKTWQRLGREALRLAPRPGICGRARAWGGLGRLAQRARNSFFFHAQTWAL
jgi:hypothetical protein